MLNEILYNEMINNNNLITTSQAENIGISKALLSKYNKQGLIERVRQGIYILPDSIHDDMYTLMLKSKYIIFSHETALFLLGLSNRTPFTHSVTIPSNTTLPKSLALESKIYYIDSKLHDLGLIEIKNTFGNTVRCYNKERTICDILRSRSRIDEETVISSIKNYVSCKDKDLNLLFKYAKLFHVDIQIRIYLEILI